MATSVGRRILAVALCLALTGVSAARAQSNPKIAERDQLNVTVWGFKEFTNKYPVGNDGMIDFPHPQIGRIKVAGLTVREAADLISRRLKEESVLLAAQVTVELEQTPNKKVTVNGPVRTPGVISYAGELTLFDALVKAGGRLAEAADEVMVYRAAPALNPGGAEATTIDVNARELENGVLTKNVVLQDGDVVIVRRAQAVTVTGYVGRVGAYTVESGMNVEQVLALAGGIDPRTGSDKRIEIVRVIGGKPVTLKGVKKTDLVKPGDIIKVGRRVF